MLYKHYLQNNIALPVKTYTNIVSYLLVYYNIMCVGLSARTQINVYYFIPKFVLVVRIPLRL